MPYYTSHHQVCAFLQVVATWQLKSLHEEVARGPHSKTQVLAYQYYLQVSTCFPSTWCKALEALEAIVVILAYYILKTRVIIFGWIADTTEVTRRTQIINIFYHAASPHQKQEVIG
jgi:hypothetical protein